MAIAFCSNCGRDLEDSNPKEYCPRCWGPIPAPKPQQVQRPVEPMAIPREPTDGPHPHRVESPTAAHSGKGCISVGIGVIIALFCLARLITVVAHMFSAIFGLIGFL